MPKRAKVTELSSSKDARIAQLERELATQIAKNVSDPVVPNSPGCFEFVRHLYEQKADTSRQEHASDNVPKHTIGKMGTGMGMNFGKLLISHVVKTPPYLGYGYAYHNTVPWGGCGPNHHTAWTQPNQKNRVEFRVWGGRRYYSMKVLVSMWTMDRIFLRTLIDDTDGVNPDDNAAVQTYFTPSPEDLIKNNNKTVFIFKADIQITAKSSD